MGDGGLLVDATDPWALAGAVTSVLGDADLRENLAAGRERAAWAALDLPRPAIAPSTSRRAWR